MALNKNVPKTKSAQLKAIMKKHDISPLKKLGQNFLLNNDILNEIVDCIGVNREDYVLEIGPGMGALTQKLAEKAKKVVAVEIDRGIIPILQQNLTQNNIIVKINNAKDLNINNLENPENNINNILDLDNNNLVEIIYGDFLKQDLNTLHQMLGGKNFKVCANLPYYITTPIIMNLIMSDLPCTSLCFMIQKEVALRMASPPSKKSYGSLSIAVQYHADVEIVLNVAPENFYPAPNVDSVVVKLTKKLTPPVQVNNKELFFALTRASFVQRRKTLANNLMMGSWSLSKMQSEELLISCGFDKNIRADALSLEQFAILANNLEKII